MKIRRSPKGFTLIELLVVISIIAVLASLAVPAVTNALTKGQLAQAMSNSRQIHMAAMSMSIDGATNSDATLGWPGDLKDNSVVSDLPGYVARLAAFDYLKPGDLKIFACVGVKAYAPGTSGTATVSGSTANLNPAFQTTNSGFKVHCIRENDSSNTVFLSTKNYTYGEVITSGTTVPFGNKGFIICRKGGDATIFKAQQGGNRDLVGSITKDQSSEEVLNTD